MSCIFSFIGWCIVTWQEVQDLFIFNCRTSQMMLSQLHQGIANRCNLYLIMKDMSISYSLLCYMLSANSCKQLLPQQLLLFSIRLLCYREIQTKSWRHSCLRKCYESSDTRASLQICYVIDSGERLLIFELQTNALYTNAHKQIHCFQRLRLLHSWTCTAKETALTLTLPCTLSSLPVLCMKFSLLLIGWKNIVFVSHLQSRDYIWTLDSSQCTHRKDSYQTMRRYVLNCTQSVLD